MSACVMVAASGIPIRAGIHIGQIEVQDSGDVTGIAVNIAARVQELAQEGEVLVSQTVRDMLLGSSLTLQAPCSASGKPESTRGPRPSTPRVS